MKLTMVSVWFKCHRVTVFAMLPTDRAGKVRVTDADLQRLIPGFASLPAGSTYSVGA